MPHSGTLGNPQPYIPFGVFAGLPFWGGGLTLLAAAPGIGKTSWLLRMLFESASLHTPSAIGCHEAARWACVDLPEEVAVVMGNINKFGELPIVEWGKVTGEMIYYACIN